MEEENEKVDVIEQPKKKRIITTNKLIVLFLLLIVGVGIWASVSRRVTLSTKPENMLPGYKLFDGTSYQVQYPENWTYEETTLTGTEANIFLSEDGLGMFVIATENLPRTYSLEQYKNASLENIKQQGDVTNISEEKGYIKEQEVYRLKYDKYSQVVCQTFFINDRKAVVFSYNDSEEYKDVYEDMECI